MARIFTILAVMSFLALSPAIANANAGVPWFNPNEISSSLLPKEHARRHTDVAAPTNTAAPPKRMLAMSISRKGTSKKAAGTNYAPMGCPLAVLVSLLGLLGIGMLTRVDPVSEAEKAR